MDGVIQGPVSLSNDQRVVDRKGRTVVPLCWLNDVDHVRKQEKIGTWLVGLINDAIKKGEGLSWEDVVLVGKKIKEEKKNNKPK